MISPIDPYSSVVLSWSQFALSPRDIWQCLGTAWGGGATGIQWVKDRDAAERAGQPLNAHNYLAWNVNRADAEKPWWHFDVCSVAKSCLTLCDPMDSSTPGFPVLHYLPELKLMSIESVMPSNHLILCHPLLFWPSVFASNRVFSNESVLRVRWSVYWSVSISPSHEYSGLISFRIDWFDILTVQGNLKSLLQHHSSKSPILPHSAFVMVQLSLPYVTTGKTISLTIWALSAKWCLCFLMFCLGLSWLSFQGARVF